MCKQSSKGVQSDTESRSTVQAVMRGKKVGVVSSCGTEAVCFIQREENKHREDVDGLKWVLCLKLHEQRINTGVWFPGSLNFLCDALDPPHLHWTRQALGWWTTLCPVLTFLSFVVQLQQIKKGPADRRWNLPSQMKPSGQKSLSFLGPEKVQGLCLPLLPLVDPPQAQDVEQDGQHHDQDAEREQVVVVDEGGAQPAGVVLPQGFLLQVPGEMCETGKDLNSWDTFHTWLKTLELKRQHKQWRVHVEASWLIIIQKRQTYFCVCLVVPLLLRGVTTEQTCVFLSCFHILQVPIRTCVDFIVWNVYISWFVHVFTVSFTWEAGNGFWTG